MLLSMKVWIHVNGVQQGPYTLEQLEAMRLPAATPVLFEGLAQWVPECQAPALASLYGGAPAAHPGHVAPGEEEVAVETVETVSAGSREQQAAYSAYGAQQQAAADAPRRPATFLVWSIVLTLCCCTPFSIAAIVCGAITNTRYNRGDYEGARRMSHATEWLVIISITLGIVGLPLTMLSML